MTTAVKAISHPQKVIRKNIVARQGHSVPVSTLSVHIALTVAIQSTTKMAVSVLKALAPGFRTRLRSVPAGAISPVLSKAATVLVIITMTVRAAISLVSRVAIVLVIITVTARAAISPVLSKAAIVLAITTMARVVAISPVRSKAAIVLAITMMARVAISLVSKAGVILLVAVTSLVVVISLVHKAAISHAAVTSRVVISPGAIVRIRPTMTRMRSTA